MPDYDKQNNECTFSYLVLLHFPIEVSLYSASSIVSQWSQGIGWVVVGLVLCSEYPVSNRRPVTTCSDWGFSLRFSHPLPPTMQIYVFSTHNSFQINCTLIIRIFNLQKQQFKASLNRRSWACMCSGAGPSYSSKELSRNLFE